MDHNSWGGILLFLGGDLEYLCNVVGLPHYNSPDAMCACCRANTTNTPFNNFHADARWRGTLVANAEYMARIRKPLHALVQDAVFNSQTYRFDLIHMCDHHGVTSHVIANVLWAHVSADREGDIIPGDTVEDRLAALNMEVKEFYTRRRVSNRLPKIKRTNLKDGDYPELKGNGVKAANTRALLPYACELQGRANYRCPSRKNRQMLLLVNALQHAYDLMYDSGPVLAKHTWTDLAATLTTVGQSYQLLSVIAFDAGKLRWNNTPKLHYVAGHLADQARLINPVWTQGYSSESMVGVLCAIYAGSQSGPFHRGIQRVAMLKYRTALLLSWP